MARNLPHPLVSLWPAISPRTFAPYASLVLLAGTALPLAAQTHHVDAPERVTRAVAVYEYTGELDKPKAARLVPVSLYINGHMEDASVFLARPVPFALQTGNIYTVEQAGEAKGAFALDHARNLVPKLGPTAEATASWYGYGKFAPPPAAAKAPALRRIAPVAIVSTADPDRPHLNTKSATPAAPATKTSDTDKAINPDPKPDTTKPDGTKTTSSASSANSKDSKDPKDPKDPKADDDPERPTLRKRDPAVDAQRRKALQESGVKPPEFSLNEDPDRPRIHRGAAPGVASTDELTGLPADLHQIAAVSDPANREPHIFAREWDSPAERADTLAKLQALARLRVTDYLHTNHLTPGTPLPAASTAGTPAEATRTDAPPKLVRGQPKEYRTPSASSSKTAPAKTRAATKAPTSRPGANQPLTLTHEQLLPYTLSYGGLPTFVYTAQTDVQTGGPVYVTLVAQRILSGDLQTALSSVTDATHLNRTPWMRPIDAVDPDASHRASLLFELRAQTSREFALYRLTSAQAEQTFVTGPMQ